MARSSSCFLLCVVLFVSVGLTFAQIEGELSSETTYSLSGGDTPVDLQSSPNNNYYYALKTASLLKLHRDASGDFDASTSQDEYTGEPPAAIIRWVQRVSGVYFAFVFFSDAVNSAKVTRYNLDLNSGDLEGGTSQTLGQPFTPVDAIFLPDNTGDLRSLYISGGARKTISQQTVSSTGVLSPVRNYLFYAYSLLGNSAGTILVAGSPYGINVFSRNTTNGILSPIQKNLTAPGNPDLSYGATTSYFTDLYFAGAGSSIYCFSKNTTVGVTAWYFKASFSTTASSFVDVVMSTDNLFVYAVSFSNSAGKVYQWRRFGSTLNAIGTGFAGGDIEVALVGSLSKDQENFYVAAIKGISGFDRTLVTPSPSNTPSNTVTRTRTRSRSPTRSRTPSRTPSHSFTRSRALSRTKTRTRAASRTRTPSASRSAFPP